MPGKTCEICGIRTAVFVCQKCGRTVCPECQSELSCSICGKDPSTQSPKKNERTDLPRLPALAIILTIVGVILIITGSLANESSSGSEGCLFWPFPPILVCGLGGPSALPGFLVGLAILFLILVSLCSFALKIWSPRKFGTSDT